MALLKTQGKEAAAAESRHLDDFPEYVAARNKLNELRDREKDLDQELAAIVKQETDSLAADIKVFLATGVLPNFAEREHSDRVRRDRQAELRFIREAILVQAAALEEIYKLHRDEIFVRVPDEEADAQADAHARHLQRHRQVNQGH